MYYHILGNWLEPTHKPVNEFKSLDEALKYGELLLNEYRDEMYEYSDQYEWHPEIFGVKIIDTEGHVYYESVKSGYCSGRIFQSRIYCPDCISKHTPDCHFDTCEELDSEWEYDEWIDDVVFIRCYKELSQKELTTFMMNCKKKK